MKAIVLSKLNVAGEYYAEVQPIPEAGTTPVVPETVLATARKGHWYPNMGLGDTAKALRDLEWTVLNPDGSIYHSKKWQKEMERAKRRDADSVLYDPFRSAVGKKKYDLLTDDQGEAMVESHDPLSDHIAAMAAHVHNTMVEALDQMTYDFQHNIDAPDRIKPDEIKKLKARRKRIVKLYKCRSLPARDVTRLSKLGYYPGVNEKNE